jgi:hypothetical protein
MSLSMPPGGRGPHGRTADALALAPALAPALAGPKPREGPGCSRRHPERDSRAGPRAGLQQPPHGLGERLVALLRGLAPAGHREQVRSRLAPPLGIAPLYQRTPLHLLSSPNPLPGCPTSVTGVPNKDHCVQRPVARSKHDQPTRINGP